MKSFVFILVSVLFSLNSFCQTLKLDGGYFVLLGTCMDCPSDIYDKKYSRLIITSNLPIDKLDVEGHIIVSQKNDDFGRKIIDFLPNHGQKLTFYATQCRPLDVYIDDVVTGGNKYQMHIIYENTLTTANTSESYTETPTTSDDSIPTTIATSVSGFYEGHQYIDLGLPSGTLWATCNVGASKPSAHGTYFAWGETSRKFKYRWKNYKFGDEDEGVTKYCTQSGYGYKGFSDNKIELECSDDVATKKWGNGWCTPSVEQFRELRNECYWQWNYYHGSHGFIVYRALNENDKGRLVWDADLSYSPDRSIHIFLPAGGYYQGIHNEDFGYAGYYWSRSLCLGLQNCGHRLYIDEGNIDTNEDERRFGYSVRPVRCQ